MGTKVAFLDTMILLHFRQIDEVDWCRELDCEWDAENRLKRVLKNNVEQARFAYDPSIAEWRRSPEGPRRATRSIVPTFFGRPGAPLR